MPSLFLVTLKSSVLKQDQDSVLLDTKYEVEPRALNPQPNAWMKQYPAPHALHIPPIPINFISYCLLLAAVVSTAPHALHIPPINFISYCLLLAAVVSTKPRGIAQQETANAIRTTLRTPALN